VGKNSSPGPQEKRFAAYMDGLAQAAGHADRATPLKLYCTGLLLPGERKSVEPIAARLAPDKYGAADNFRPPNLNLSPVSFSGAGHCF